MAGNISLRKIWAVARTEWMKWVCNPRMIMIPVLTVFIYSYAVIPLLERCEKMGEPLNLLEPLIAVGNSGWLTLIIPIVFLTLMSDFPKTDGSAVFFLPRTGRINWMFGQILFGLMGAATFLGAIYIICTMFLMNKAFLANGWSMVVKKYNLLFPEEAHTFAAELIPGNLYNQMTPFSAVIQTYLLLFLYLITVLLVLLFFQQRKHRAAGFLVANAVIGFGVLFTTTKASAMWAFPMANAIVWLHYTELYRDAVVPAAYSYIYFGVIITLLIMVNTLAAGRLNVDSIEETEG
ncbi:MAG: hypothetical protein ACI4EX_07270 [Lachnospiraceae bacterium]